MARERNARRRLLCKPRQQCLCPFVAPRVAKIHAFQLPICPAIRFSRHLVPPQKARVNADLLPFTTPRPGLTSPAIPCPSRPGDFCTTRWPVAGASPCRDCETSEHYSR
ncbi:hypothetical protein GCT19_35940 [Paraburkholderia sp. CNPSo 3155]|nr:hypothetical protein [Paraburkholderia atlantica]